ANTGVTFTANNDIESITIQDDGDITEANEDGEVITVTLSGGTFADPVTSDNFTLTNLPAGVTKGSVNRIGATQVTIKLSGNRTADYDDNITDLTLNITNNEVDDHTGADLVVSTGVTFTAADEPDAVISGSGEVCDNGETFDIRFDLSNGVSPWTIKYKKPDNSEEEVTGITVSPHYVQELQDGTYTLVEVKGDDGLIGFVSGSADITVNPLPTPSIESRKDSYCENTVGTYYTLLNAGSTYQWKIISGGVFAGDSDLDTVAIRWNWDVDKGYIRVIETDSKGCTDSTDIYEAEVDWAPEAPGITGDSEFCEGSSALIQCDVTIPYGYLWNTTATSQSIVVTEPGTFTVQRGAANGCLSKPSAPFDVSKNPKPIATIAIEGEDSICIDDVGTFDISLFTGTPPYTVGYEGFASATNVYPDDFQLTGSLPEPGKIAYTLLSVVDDKGCTGQILNNTDTIVVNESPAINFNPSVTTYFNNDDPVLLEADPPGGTFVGAAVTGGNTFHPQLADTLLPNPVIYFYTHPVTGCPNSDTVEFTVIVTPAEIHAPNAHMYLDTFVYCFDALQDTLTGTSVYGNPGGTFTGEGIINIGNDKAIFDPAEAGTGVHEIAYNYTINVDSLIYIWGLDTLFMPIIIDIDTVQVPRPAPPLVEVFEVDAPGSMIISGLLDEYCTNGDSVRIELIGSINNEDVPGFEGIQQLTGTGVSGPNEGYYWFNPREGSVGTRILSYTYTRDFSQCIIHDEKEITVNPTPSLDFKVMDTCMFVTAGTDSILFKNLSPDIASVVSWEWDFGDGGSSTSESPWHDYNSVGTKLIVLEATNNFGCSDFTQKIIEFQEISRAYFDWSNECFGDTIYFTADDDQGRVISYKWDFADGS
ncbi:MAG: PKD domain-containing protein, partial [Bacteroidales bacterium]